MSERRVGTTRLRDIARENRAEPPSRSHIDALPSLGDAAFAMDLSGVSIRFKGLDDDLASAARKRFEAYACEPDAAPSPLVAGVHRDPIEHYVEPERTRGEGYYRLRIVHDAGLIRLVTYSMAAWIDLAASRAGVAFGSGTYDPRERAFENFCRVAVAWMAVARGGFFIHGASIVRNGRAYVFFGQSAAGKSTLAGNNREGRVISDDLTLVLPSPAGYVVAGSPFRGTYGGGEPVVGVFPLAGMFRLVQDERTFVESPKKIRAFSEFVANLPFVNDALSRYPAHLDALDRAAAVIPIHFLHLERLSFFWPAVDEALGGR